MSIIHASVCVCLHCGRRLNEQRFVSKRKIKIKATSSQLSKKGKSVSIAVVNAIHSPVISLRIYRVKNKLNEWRKNLLCAKMVSLSDMQHSTAAPTLYGYTSISSTQVPLSESPKIRIFIMGKSIPFNWIISRHSTNIHHFQSFHAKCKHIKDNTIK